VLVFFVLLFFLQFVAFLLLWTFTAVVLCLSLSLLSVSTCSMVEGAVPVMYVFVRWATAYFRNEQSWRGVLCAPVARSDMNPTPRLDQAAAADTDR